MKALARIIVGLVLLAVVVVGGAAVALMAVDPNSYKGQISAAVKESTGRNLAIAGDIDVMFYPVLGFKVAGLALGNPAGFAEKEFINANEVQAGVKIIPLLSKKIEVTTVRLVKPSITVVKNADGKTNLELPKKESADKAATPNFDISVEAIEVSDAQVTYIDKATGKTTSITPLNLKMPGYAPGRDIPVSLDMVINDPAPAKPIKLDVSATMNARPDKGEFTFRDVKSNIDLGGAKAEATAQVTLNTKTKEISIADLEAGWQGTSLKGQATVKNFTNPAVTFDVSSPSVDLDALLPKDPAQAKNNNKPLLPVDMLRKLTLDGKAAIGTLKTAGLTMSNVRLDVTARDGVLNASPLTLNMYDGALNTNVRIDARGAAPAFNIKGGLKGMEVGKFLTAKMGQDYLTGVANIDFDLNSRGNTMDALNKASGGRIGFDFGKGYINKWQLSKLINQALAYIETGKLDPNADDKVYFTSLHGVFSGQNGVFSNDNLVLVGPKSHALGSGTVNLGAQSVNYAVRVGGGDDPEKFAQAKHLPVRIQGPLSKPSYALDMQSLIEDAASQKIEEKKEELMENLFKKLDRSSETSSPSEPSATDPAAIEPAAPPTPEKELDPLKSLLQGL